MSFFPARFSAGALTSFRFAPSKIQFYFVRNSYSKKKLIITPSIDFNRSELGFASSDMLSGE